MRDATQIQKVSYEVIDKIQQPEDDYNIRIAFTLLVRPY